MLQKVCLHLKAFMWPNYILSIRTVLIWRIWNTSIKDIIRLEINRYLLPIFQQNYCSSSQTAIFIIYSFIIDSFIEIKPSDFPNNQQLTWGWANMIISFWSCRNISILSCLFNRSCQITSETEQASIGFHNYTQWCHPDVASYESNVSCQNIQA